MQQNVDVVATLKYYNEYLSTRNILHGCITCIERRYLSFRWEQAHTHTHTKEKNKKLILYSLELETA